MDSQRKIAIPAGVFLVGFGFLLMTHHLFPGFLLLIAAVAAAHAWTHGNEHDTLRVAGLFGFLWLLFAIGFNFPFLLMLIGAGVLFMAFTRSEKGHDRHESWDHLKAEWEKHWDAPTEEEMPKPKNDNLYI
jgi:hypothetical protein